MSNLMMKEFGMNRKDLPMARYFKYDRLWTGTREELQKEAKYYNRLSKRTGHVERYLVWPVPGTFGMAQLVVAHL